MITLIPFTGPVDAEVHIPGSKSMTNRALVMAALSRQCGELREYLRCDDTEAMISCLKKIGMDIQIFDRSLLVAHPINFTTKDHRVLYARLSGTTIRFLSAVALLLPGSTVLRGEDGLNKRPIGDLGTALSDLGAGVQYQHAAGCPPIMITAAEVPGHHARLSGKISSQYCSAILMIAPLLDGCTLDIDGEQISKSYIDITIKMMKEWGVNVENREYRQYVVRSGQKYHFTNYTIEGDYSSAAYFAGLAALSRSTITMHNLHRDTSQGDREFLDILASMGNAVSYDHGSVTVHGCGVKPVVVDMQQCPDQAQTLAVLAAFANGKTIMTGVRSLRVKETERVQAVQSELAKMGIVTESPDDDTLIVFGGSPHKAIIDTWGDHRMAMSFALAGARISGLQIRNPEVVTKTFPEFWQVLSSVGVRSTTHV